MKLIFMFMFLVLMMTFIIQRTHFLSCLLILEMLLITVIMQSIFFINHVSLLTMFLLLLAACSSAVGLSMLVVMSRTIGKDSLCWVILYKK